MPRTRLPQTVKALGLVSLLTDVSSEMIYPLLPAFVMGSLKAGPAFLGLVEGSAEAAASLVKVVSGAVSDRIPRRKPLVVLGYGLSSLVRPLIALATAPWHVFAIRFADRVGKGTRGAPRDALLAEVAAADQRGRAYGFHRAMDHTGALVGPLLASAALLWWNDVRTVFALAALPALASLVVLLLGVREPSRVHASPSTSISVPSAPGPLPRGLAHYLVVVAVFTLGNSSDAFLLLRAEQAGVSLPFIPFLWAFHHLVKAASSTAGGALSDRFGRRSVVAAGWGVYALAYVGLAIASRPHHVWLLFGAYGLYHALTEGPERALVVDLAGGRGVTGRAFGLYHGVTGFMLLPASLLAGALWQWYGAATALGAGAVLAGLASGGLLFVPEPSTSRWTTPPS